MTERLFQMGVTVGGVPASQVPSALFWYGEIIRACGMKGILELGTEKGGLALFFGLHCPHATFTVDVVDQTDSHTKWLFPQLGIFHTLADCRDETVARKLMDDLRARPRLVFCDNGYKVDEFPRYAALLEPGDVIGVHDCGTEFFPDGAEAQAVVAACNLERIYQAELDADRTVAAFWRKR